MSQGSILGMASPQRLRQELRHGSGAALRRRRAVIGLSLVGIASMAAVSLFQTGVLRHLPDLPLDAFDSDRVTSSDAAFAYPAPDGTLALAIGAGNIVLAAMGGAGRAEDTPWIPLTAAGLAGAAAAVGAWSLVRRMPREGVWCSWCILDALANLGAFLLVLPEAGTAAANLGERAVRPKRSARAI